MAKQAITLKIAGKSYPFDIESGKEEIYRLAEREVNNYLALIKQQNIKGWKDQDYLAMAALKFAIVDVGMRQSRRVDSEEVRRLEALDAEIDTYLNTLKP
ncbi:cell division protein ZapA [uncultured Alistipes sp.]|uniref:cell division protein ZapA n=1 Tax=uncultured Alistipes sp. TaxID=538949 RepID=UPI00280552A0|nr:cell division protein ZapA [uncultured Alistipes sp.]